MLEEAAPTFDDGTLWRLIERRAAETPHARMLVDETGRSLSFAEYRDAAERVAAGLAGLGVTTDTVVSWQLPTWIESTVLVAALARLGAVQNPLVPIYRDREVTFCVQQTHAELLIVPSVWRGFDYRAMGRRVAAAIGTVEVLVADRSLPEGDPATLAPPAPATDPEAAPVRWIYYTSGSTADPKGAKHTDPGLAAAAIAFLGRLELGPDDRVALVFPFSHIGGSNFLFSALMTGCTSICVEIFEPRTAVDVLAREGVTIAGAGTPFHLAYLDVQRARGPEPIFAHLRACNGGGGPKPAGLHYDVQREGLGGRGVISGYGLTECPVLAMNDLHSDDEALSRSEGRPSPGVDMKIVRPDGVSCAPGEEGEICAKAPQMLVGYVDATLDADGFDGEGYFRTGDLGYRLPGGHIVVSGRLKDIIIRKGENISAKEVEDLLYLHPSVAEVAVIGLPDPDLGERCCAVVVPRSRDHPLTFEEMGDYLRRSGLMMQKIPEQLVIRNELPRAPAGKVLKQDLKRQLAGVAGVAR